MKQRENRLLKKTNVQEKLEEAVVLAKEFRSEKPTMTSIRDLMEVDEIKNVMEDILDTSSMSNTLRNYVRAVFIDRIPKQKAIRKAFGRDIGYQEEAVIAGIMENPVVKEFVDVVKMFYVQALPIAALREVDIMLNPMTKAETVLKAAQQIKAGAGVGIDTEKAQLPVRIVINMPQQHNTTINMPGEEDKK